METKPPLPPFTPQSAAQKVRLAEDAWNSRDPDRVVPKPQTADIADGELRVVLPPVSWTAVRLAKA